MGMTLAAPGDKYRHYEMAGAGHATTDELYYSADPDDIVKARLYRHAARPDFRSVGRDAK